MTSTEKARAIVGAALVALAVYYPAPVIVYLLYNIWGLLNDISVKQVQSISHVKPTGE